MVFPFDFWRDGKVSGELDAVELRGGVRGREDEDRGAVGVEEGEDVGGVEEIAGGNGKRSGRAHAQDRVGFGVESAVRILEKAWPIYEVESDLVADASTYDLDVIFNWGSSADILRDSVLGKKSDFVSAYAKVADKADQAIAKLLEQLEGCQRHGVRRALS